MRVRRSAASGGADRLGVHGDSLRETQDFSKRSSGVPEGPLWASGLCSAPNGTPRAACDVVAPVLSHDAAVPRCRGSLRSAPGSQLNGVAPTVRPGARLGQPSRQLGGRAARFPASSKFARDRFFPWTQIFNGDQRFKPTKTFDNASSSPLTVCYAESNPPKTTARMLPTEVARAAFDEALQYVQG